MLSRSASVLAACALSASAFLIPTDVSTDAFTDKAIDVVKTNAKSLALKLPCSECAFSYNSDEQVQDVNDDGSFTIQGGANSVVVNFTISTCGQRLVANGEPVYPMRSLLSDMFNSQKHYVKQVPQSATLEDIKSGKAKSASLEVTGHRISIVTEEGVSEKGEKLIPIKYTIYELNGQPVSIAEVTLQLLSTKEHGLLIAHSETSERPTQKPDDSFGNTPEGLPLAAPPSEDTAPGALPAGFGKHEECKNLPAAVCRLRKIIADKVMAVQNGLKKGQGCGGRKGPEPTGGVLTNHMRPHFQQESKDGERHHGLAHHMRPHGDNGPHHSPRKSFYQSFTRGLSAVMIPSIAGITVGMLVSLIGLVVGRLIGFFWIRYYRGGRRGYSGLALDETTDIAKESEIESAKISMESAPPIYEDAPAYEVIEKEEK